MVNKFLWVYGLIVQTQPHLLPSFQVRKDRSGAVEETDLAWTYTDFLNAVENTSLTNIMNCLISLKYASMLCCRANMVIVVVICIIY